MVARGSPVSAGSGPERTHEVAAAWVADTARMNGYARYWIFFVIVAVGLVLSWGQVGRKTDQVMAEQDVIYLQTEVACRPQRAPCAAVAHDRALVLGPDGDGLQLRSAGFDADHLLGIEYAYVDADGEEISRSGIDRLASSWRIGRPPTAAGKLRASVLSNGEKTVAEFPLSISR